MGARRTAPNVVNTPTGTRLTSEDERERMPIADDPVTRPTFFKSPAQERSASRIPMFTPEFKERMRERIEREKFNDRRRRERDIQGDSFGRSPRRRREVRKDFFGRPMRGPRPPFPTGRPGGPFGGPRDPRPPRGPKDPRNPFGADPTRFPPRPRPGDRPRPSERPDGTRPGPTMFGGFPIQSDPFVEQRANRPPRAEPHGRPKRPRPGGFGYTMNFSADATPEQRKAAYEKYKPRGFRPFPSRRNQERRMAGQSFGDFFGRREQNIAQTDI